MTVEVVRDAINDRLRATATLRANGERIEIRCREPDWGDVSIQYHSRRWIARGNFFSGMQPVTYRFDDHAPIRRLWHVRDRTASFDDRGRVIAFVGALMGARRLVLRTRDIENRTFDADLPDRRNPERHRRAAPHLRIAPAQPAPHRQAVTRPSRV